jgi:hypothetical protein
MPQKQHARQLGADRAGLDGFRVAAESGPQIPQNCALRQAAEHRLRRQRLAEPLYRLGSRVVFELLDELARHHGIGDDIDQRLGAYAALERDLLRALDGDRFQAGPMPGVGGSR